MSNFDTKHDFQVDITITNAKDKQYCIKDSNSNIWKKNLFKIPMFFNKT